jgi:hypothetical protein
VGYDTRVLLEKDWTEDVASMYCLNLSSGIFVKKHLSNLLMSMIFELHCIMFCSISST